jgi:biopolymer transport protein TolR
MALNPGASKGQKTSLSEINVTPMVDVMLVLLIVFMVSAPLLQQGVEVELPKADSATVAETEEPTVLVIRADQSLELDRKPVTPEALSSRLESLVRARPEVQVLVQADQSVNYGAVAKAMAKLKKLGIRRVGLITAPGTD